jgi:hypothetical protein
LIDNCFYLLRLRNCRSAASELLLRRMQEMSDRFEDDEEENTLDFDHEAAEKAGYSGVPIEELDEIALREIERVSKGE